MNRPGPDAFRGLAPEEKMLLRVKPDWKLMARTAFHTRKVAIYFGIFALVAAASGSPGGVMACLIGGAMTIGILASMGWLAAKSTTYVLTDQRLVMQIGMAVDKVINLPLKQVEAAAMKSLGGTSGDIALTLKGEHPLSYALLWPHARPWKLSNPQPMLRSLADAPAFARTLADATAAHADIARAPIDADTASPRPGKLEEAVA